MDAMRSGTLPALLALLALLALASPLAAASDAALGVLVSGITLKDRFN